MCTPFKIETVTDWLDRQIAVLDCWLDSESLNAGMDMRLMETLQIHSDWLKAERAIMATLPARCLISEPAI